jgi:colanic acid/amylovoran biosynthesis glycosyltransferase
MDMAIFTGPFPKLSKTFIINQIVGLLDRGHNITLISNIDPGEPEVHSKVLEYDLRGRTYYYQDQAPDNKLWAALKAGSILARELPGNFEYVYNVFQRVPEDGFVESGRLVYWCKPFLENEFDVIHCHFGPTGIIGAKLKSLGISGQLITTFHGHGVRKGLENKGQMYEELFEVGDCFTAVSQFTKQKLIEMGADEDKVVFHPNGVDINQFPEPGRHKNRDRKQVTVLTVARLSQEKGHRFGLKAIADIVGEYPDIPLSYRLVGHGPLEEPLKDQVNKLELEDIVTFCGPKSRDEVIEEFDNADIFLLPSLAEGLPITLLEAQASSLPIVTTSVGGIKTAVKDGETAFVVSPKQPGELADRLTELIRNPDMRLQMGREGREYAAEEYDIHSLNDDLMDVYTGSCR